MSADVHFSSQKQVKSKNHGHHVRRCPFFCPETSEDQKTRSSCPQMSIFMPQNESEDQKKTSSRPQAVVCPETFQNFS